MSKNIFIIGAKISGICKVSIEYLIIIAPIIIWIINKQKNENNVNLFVSILNTNAVFR